ncbi:MAG: hypothetical protein M3X11_19165 [Acidobacteriota bacterium]|nr:hypothetical protein [Acidobacteriota bacterium]
MNEESTKDLTIDEKLDMILSELAFLKADFGARLVKVEAFVEDRSRDTRPILDKIYKEVADLRIEVKEVKDRVVRIDRKFDVLNSDVVELRSADREFEQRLTVIERQPA